MYVLDGVVTLVKVIYSFVLFILVVIIFIEVCSCVCNNLAFFYNNEDELLPFTGKCFKSGIIYMMKIFINLIKI